MLCLHTQWHRCSCCTSHNNGWIGFRAADILLCTKYTECHSQGRKLACKVVISDLSVNSYWLGLVKCYNCTQPTSAWTFAVAQDQWAFVVDVYDGTVVECHHTPNKCQEATDKVVQASSCCSKGFLSGSRLKGTSALLGSALQAVTALMYSGSL